MWQNRRFEVCFFWVGKVSRFKRGGCNSIRTPLHLLNQSRPDLEKSYLMHLLSAPSPVILEEVPMVYCSHNNILWSLVRSPRYRKQMEEMQRAFNKTIIKLQNTSRIAEEQVGTSLFPYVNLQMARRTLPENVGVCRRSSSD